MRIFNSEYVEELICEWKISKDDDVMNEIINESTPLARYIASRYVQDKTAVDDFAQEALLKISSSIEHYDPSVANPHTYFATIIRNSCNTSMIKYRRSLQIEEESELSEYENIACYSEKLEYNDDVLKDLIIRNRKRFPSVSVDAIDGITEQIFLSLCDGNSLQRGVLMQIISEYNVAKSIVSIIYHSTLIYLRRKYYRMSIKEIEVDEFSLLPEMQELLGDKLLTRFAIMFSGTYFKVY